MKNNNKTISSNYNLAIIAIVAALAVFGVVLVTVAETMQQAEAQRTGCPVDTPAPNASRLRCFRP